MRSLMSCIEDKYVGDNEDDDFGFIVFVSSSPESKRGLFPPVMTLCDFDINSIGYNGINVSRLSHIRELDLTDNLISQWAEVLKLLTIFRSLEFLNLSNNLLSQQFSLSADEMSVLAGSMPLRKLILNGNRISWSSAQCLARLLPHLEELHLSNNDLNNPEEDFRHAELRKLSLTCNNIDSFDQIYQHLAVHCPALEVLSLAECPLTSVPQLDQQKGGFIRLTTLNLTTTQIRSWEDVDRLSTFPRLTEVRFKNCPLLDNYTAHEKRMFLIARLPGVSILNGGDHIPANEREDAERAFIRHYMDMEAKDQPARYSQLLSIHGRLDPLVNVNMKPATHVKVRIIYKEDHSREEVISLYQTVQQFKSLLYQWFQVPVANMRLYYCDQVMSQAYGPEEMKWPQKDIYTYNVRDGDSFILDEKVSVGKLDISRACSFSTSGSSLSSSRSAITLGIYSPSSPGSMWSPLRSRACQPNRPSASHVARNLFPASQNATTHHDLSKKPS